MSYYGPRLAADLRSVEQNLEMEHSTLMGTLPVHAARAGPCQSKPSFRQFKKLFQERYPSATATEEDLFHAWKGIPSYSFRDAFVEDAFVYVNIPRTTPSSNTLPARQIENSKSYPKAEALDADILLGQIE